MDIHGVYPLLILFLCVCMCVYIYIDSFIIGCKHINSQRSISITALKVFLYFFYHNLCVAHYYRLVVALSKYVL